MYMSRGFCVAFSTRYNQPNQAAHPATYSQRGRRFGHQKIKALKVPLMFSGQVSTHTSHPFGPA